MEMGSAASTTAEDEGGVSESGVEVEFIIDSGVGANVGFEGARLLFPLVCGCKLLRRCCSIAAEILPVIPPLIPYPIPGSPDRFSIEIFRLNVPTPNGVVAPETIPGVWYPVVSTS